FQVIEVRLRHFATLFFTTGPSLDRLTFVIPGGKPNHKKHNCSDKAFCQRSQSHLSPHWGMTTSSYSSAQPVVRPSWLSTRRVAAWPEPHRFDCATLRAVSRVRIPKALCLDSLQQSSS